MRNLPLLTLALGVLLVSACGPDVATAPGELVLGHAESGKTDGINGLPIVFRDSGSVRISGHDTPGTISVAEVAETGIRVVGQVYSVGQPSDGNTRIEIAPPEAEDGAGPELGFSIHYRLLEDTEWRQLVAPDELGSTLFRTVEFALGENQAIVELGSSPDAPLAADPSDILAGSNLIIPLEGLESPIAEYAIRVVPTDPSRSVVGEYGFVLRTTFSFPRRGPSAS